MISKKGPLLFLFLFTLSACPPGPSYIRPKNPEKVIDLGIDTERNLSNQALQWITDQGNEATWGFVPYYGLSRKANVKILGSTCGTYDVPAECTINIPFRLDTFQLIWTRHSDSDKVGKPAHITSNPSEASATFRQYDHRFTPIIPPPQYAPGRSIEIHCNHYNWIESALKNNQAHAYSYSTERLTRNSTTGESKPALSEAFYDLTITKTPFSFLVVNDSKNKNRIGLENELDYYSLTQEYYLNRLYQEGRNSYIFISGSFGQFSFKTSKDPCEVSIHLTDPVPLDSDLPPADTQLTPEELLSFQEKLTQGTFTPLTKNAFYNRFIRDFTYYNPSFVNCMIIDLETGGPLCFLF